MLLTQVLATAFVFVGWCITIYVIGVQCYCVVLGIDLDEDKLMVVVVGGVSLMSIIFMLTLFLLIYELTLHLIS